MACLDEAKDHRDTLARVKYEKMTPISIKISDVTYVDFKKKVIVDRIVLPFDKHELLLEGLIDFNRIIRRGYCVIVAEAS